MQTDIIIREGVLQDLPELQELFVETITNCCKEDYNQDQIEAWISATVERTNAQHWRDIIKNQVVIVAERGFKSVGFITLDADHYIDFFYVHKDHQGEGIGNQLYTCIENQAIQDKNRYLMANVSKTARNFFEKRQFKILTKQTVIRKGISLTNFKMMKNLN